MRINTKILKFFQELGVSNKEIADSYGGTPQNIWNILNKDTERVPLDFLIWIAENYPQLNINSLLKKDNNSSIISEPYTVYEKRPATKQDILKEISAILDKYL
ncbi:MAG: hypothetical protein ACOH1X_02735 [Kaistella sp.]